MTPPRAVAQFLQAALQIQLPYDRVLDVKEALRVARLERGFQDPIVGWLTEHSCAQWEMRFLVSRLVWTDAGLDYARQVQQASQRRALRDTHLHNALVRWAYEHSPDAVDVAQFTATHEWWFLGTEVTWPQVGAALRYLEGEGLLSLQSLPTNSVLVRTTNMGINFAMQEEDLRSFMANQPRRITGAVTNNVHIHGNANYSSIASGSHISQSMSNGVNANELISLVSRLRQIAPALGLSADDNQDLTDEIDALEREGSERSRGQKIWRRIARIMTPALTSAAVAGTEQAAQAVIAMGSHTFD